MDFSNNAFLSTLKTALLYLQMHSWVYYVLILTFLGLIGIIVMTAPKEKIATQTKITPPLATNKDITAIAGEDVISTQLDLAKAYIEMDQHELAKKILKDALKSGSTDQRQKARELFEALS